MIGASGFIGNACFKYFSVNNQVTGVDCAGAPAKDLYIDADFILTRTLISEKFDVILNCAGSSNIQGSFTDTGSDFKSNVVFVQQILDAVKTLSPSAKIINLSSAAVYGNPETLPIGENTQPKPLSPYGLHKLLAEQVMQEYARLSGLKTLSVRIFSAYGPGLKRQFFYDLYTKFNSENKQIHLTGTGGESRDFIYISDITRALELLMDKGEFNGSVYNLATQHESFIDHSARLFAGICGYKGEIKFSQKQFEGYPLNWKADTGKLTSLGFSPKVNLEQGLQLYFNWLKEISQE